MSDFPSVILPNWQRQLLFTVFGKKMEELIGGMEEWKND